MNGFLAVILICGMGLKPSDCTRETAIDVIVRAAAHPMECMLSAQPLVAATGLARDGTYTVMRCERRKE